MIAASRKASVQALDTKTGTLIWDFPYGNNMWVESSPRLAGDKIFIGASGSLMVVGLDYKTGKASSMFMSKAFHWSTPLVVNDAVYVGGAAFSDEANGALFALPLTEGKLPLTGDGKRLLKVSNTLESSGKISGVAGSPVLADGVLYFGGLDGNLYAVKD